VRLGVVARVALCGRPLFWRLNCGIGVASWEEPLFGRLGGSIGVVLWWEALLRRLDGVVMVVAAWKTPFFEIGVAIVMEPALGK
jgi:hypothetical protein